MKEEISLRVTHKRFSHCAVALSSPKTALILQLFRRLLDPFDFIQLSCYFYCIICLLIVLHNNLGSRDAPKLIFTISFLLLSQASVVNLPLTAKERPLLFFSAIIFK